MNFQQLKYVRAAVHNGFNLTEVASILFTSQSGVSKQIKELEAELGIEIFVRRGKRLVAMTKAGESVVLVIERLLAEADNLKRLSEQFKSNDKGRLVIATTHNQARYTLPQILVRFTQMFPDVEIELRQGTPKYVVDSLVRGEADVGIATDTIDEFPELASYSCFTWDHVVVVPPHHPLTRVVQPSLHDVAKFPIITYNAEFSGRAQIDRAFEEAGLAPDLRLTAMDADVIKTYVRLGMGVGIIAEIAVADDGDDALMQLRGSNTFFTSNVTKIAMLRNTLLPNYAYRLIQLYAPHVDYAALTGAKRRADFAKEQSVSAFSQRLDLHSAPRRVLSGRQPVTALRPCAP